MQIDSVDQMIQTWARTAPELDVRPLEVVGRLLLCAHHLQQRLVDVLDPLGLSFGDFDVLNTLRRRGDPGGTNPSELAQSSLVTTGAMTARLHRLDQAGLITRTEDPSDGRAIWIHLTGQGRRLVERALTAVIAADETFLEPLTDRQRDQLAFTLRLLLLSQEQPQQDR